MSTQPEKEGSVKGGRKGRDTVNNEGVEFQDHDFMLVFIRGSLIQMHTDMLITTLKSKIIKNARLQRYCCSKS